MSTTESNYMNGNYITSTREGDNHISEADFPGTVHYHSSRVPNHLENGYAGTNSSNGYSTTSHNRNPNGQSNMHQSLPYAHSSVTNGHGGTHNSHKNGYDDMESNGVDSGQGSSLDRDYSSYNGHVSYGTSSGPNSYNQTTTTSRNSQQTNQQFYYNIPANTVREDEITNGPASNTSVSPRRRPPGDTLDLSNREYRGSAFELYKKPGYSFPPNQYNDIPK